MANTARVARVGQLLEHAQQGVSCSGVYEPAPGE
jgi:hypothetical protein